MRALSRFTGVFFCCFILSVFAQQQAVSPSVAPSANSSTQASPDDHRISIDAVVTDKSGRPVAGLSEQDFTLLDGKQRQAITSFRAVDDTHKPNHPVQAIFVVDAVNTSLQTILYERKEVNRFLLQNGGKLPVPATLMIFTETSAQMQPVPTTDGNALADELNSSDVGRRMVGRSAGFWGGTERLSESLSTLRQLTAFESKRPGRKLLIWMSPGWPLFPDLILNAKQEAWIFNEVVTLSKELREARVTLYSVDPLGNSDAGSMRTTYYEAFLKGVKSARQADNADLALQVLATQSGGRVLTSSNDIAKEMGECLVDAPVYYTMTFEAPPADGPNEYHSLELKVDKPGLVARTRMGYYDQPAKATPR